MALLEIHNKVQAEKFTATSSAQTPLIVFSLTRKKLIASLGFLFPKSLSGFSGAPLFFDGPKACFCLLLPQSAKVRARPGLRGVECKSSIRGG